MLSVIGRNNRPTFFRIFLLVFVLCLATMAGSGLARAQENFDIKSLPSKLSLSNAGTDFYFSFPPGYEEVFGPNNGCRIFVASSVRQLVTVEVEGVGYKQAQICQPNDVTDFFIAQSQAQPFIKAGNERPPSEKIIYRKAGVRVYAKAPIVVYGVTRFAFTSDGFLAVPISGLGTEYVVAAYPRFTAVGSTFQLPSQTTITAAYDETEVSFEMGGTLNSRTVGGLRVRQRDSWTLNKGDVIYVADDGDGQDISGSYIRATKPVAVVSGNQCANVPAGVFACDYMSEMELPMNSWGKVYHVTPIVNRLFNPVIRIFAKEPNTTVFLNGQEWLRLSRNSRAENQGFVERRLGGGPTVATISADKPIYIMLYNPGQTDDNIPSDPFQLVLTPVELYQREIIFTTPGSKQGLLPFSSHFVNLVYQTGPGGSIPDDLEFATIVNGQPDWRRVSQRFGSNPGQEFQGTVNGASFAMKRLTLPGDGVYKIRASKPFAAYAYGFSTFDSYGFPTSVAVGDVNSPDTVAPDPKWTQECDGTVKSSLDDPNGGRVTDLPNDPEIRSNLALVYMDANPDSSFNYTFNYDREGVFVVGQTVSSNWEAKVTDLSKDARAKIWFVDRAGNDTSITLLYKAFSVAMSPEVLNYGLLKAGESKTDTVTLTNSGTLPVTVRRLALRDNSKGFAFSTAVALPFQLAAGESRKVAITFSATADGEFQDELGIGDDCVFTYITDLRSEVVSPIIRVSDIDWGAQTRGTSVTLTLTVTNPSRVPLQISGYSGPSQPSIFRLVNWPTVNVANPLILQPGDSRVLDVEFTPPDTLSYSDRVVFSSDAQRDDSIGVLNGRGIEPGLEVTSFDWDRRRVQRTYTGTVTLRNTGNARLTLRDAVNTNVNFDYNPAEFAGLQLDPGQSYTANVRFIPGTTGPHELRVDFTSIDGKTAQSTLRGIGIQPRIETADVDFGTTEVDRSGQGTPNTRTVSFRCVPWQFDDSLTITDLTLSAGISDAMAAYGANGFRFDKPAVIGRPRVLQPGESITFSADFLAQQPGPVTANVRSVSDAEADVTSNWNGSGRVTFVPDPRITLTEDAEIDVCVGTSRELTFEVGNAGNTNIIVDSIVLVNADPQFSAFTPSSFTVASGGAPQVVRVTYTPNSSTGGLVQNIRVAIRSRGSNSPDTTITLRVSSVDYSDSLAVIGARDVEVGSVVDIPIKLRRGYSANAGVREIEVDVVTDGRLLNTNSLGLSELIPGAGMEIVNATKVAFDTIRVRVRNTDPGLAWGADATLFTVRYSVYLPYTTDYSTIVRARATLSGTQCAQISPAQDAVLLDKDCASGIRSVRGTGFGYQLVQVSPNPTTGENVAVSYSVGLEARTLIQVFSIDGELVTTLSDAVQRPGNYQISVPSETLGSGAYIVRMLSGPYSAQTELRVVR